MRFSAFRTILITVLVTSAATVVLLRWGLLPEYEPRSAPSFDTARAAEGKQPPLSPEEQINVDVYNKVSPGVVNITKTVVEYGFFLA